MVHQDLRVAAIICRHLTVLIKKEKESPNQKSETFLKKKRHSINSKQATRNYKLSMSLYRMTHSYSKQASHPLVNRLRQCKNEKETQILLNGYHMTTMFATVLSLLAQNPMLNFSKLVEEGVEIPKIANYLVMSLSFQQLIMYREFTNLIREANLPYNAMLKFIATGYQKKSTNYSDEEIQLIIILFSHSVTFFDYLIKGFEFYTKDSQDYLGLIMSQTGKDSSPIMNAEREMLLPKKSIRKSKSEAPKYTHNKSHANQIVPTSLSTISLSQFTSFVTHKKKY